MLQYVMLCHRYILLRIYHTDLAALVYAVQIVWDICLPILINMDLYLSLFMEIRSLNHPKKLRN